MDIRNRRFHGLMTENVRIRPPPAMGIRRVHGLMPDIGDRKVHGLR